MLGKFSGDLWQLPEVQPLGVQLGGCLQNVLQDKLHGEVCVSVCVYMCNIVCVWGWGVGDVLCQIQHIEQLCCFTVHATAVTMLTCMALTNGW